MAVILTTAEPETKTSGNWPYSALNSAGGSWHLDVTITAASTSSPHTTSEFLAILASNDQGGFWLTERKFQLYDQSSGSLIVTSGACTWSANQTISLTVNLVAGTNASSLVISGATTGNGTTNFTYDSHAIFSNVTLGIGVYGGGGFNFPGSLSDVDDTLTGVNGTANITLGAATLTATGDFAAHADADITLGALTSTAAGSVEVTGSANVTLGALTVDAPNGGIEGNITLGELTLVATGDFSGAEGVNGDANITLGALTSTAEGSVEVNGALNATLGAVTATAVGSVEVSGQANITLGSLSLIANNGGGLQRGDYGAARELFGSPQTSVTVTLDTQAGSLILLCTGGDLTDIDAAPTDNKGNTYTQLGGPEEYQRWPGYGIQMWYCVNANGGSNHQITQAFTQFDECTICAVEIINGAVIVDFGYNEVLTGGTLTTDSVATTGPAELVAFWSGDAPTGQTADISASNGYEILDETTLVDHPNGYVPIAILGRSAADPGSYSTTVTETPDQGAVMANVAIQVAAGIIGTSSPTLGALTVTAAGNPEVNGAADVTLGALTSSAAGVVDVDGTLDATLGELTLTAAGSVEVQGTANATLGELTVTATGLSTENNVADITLGELTLTAEGQVDISGQLDATLGAMTVAAAGVVDVNGVATVTLGVLTVSASGSIGAVEPTPANFSAASSTPEFGAASSTPGFGISR